MSPDKKKIRSAIVIAASRIVQTIKNCSAVHSLDLVWLIVNCEVSLS